MISIKEGRFPNRPPCPNEAAAVWKPAPWLKKRTYLKTTFISVRLSEAKHLRLFLPLIALDESERFFAALRMTTFSMVWDRFE
jgi:hypothetical protein